jgi:hypothetical protein
MKIVKIEITKDNKKPEKYNFKGDNALEQLANLLNTKFSISIQEDKNDVRNR